MNHLKWSVLEICEALGCAVYGENASDKQLAKKTVTHVTIDTREVREGSLFVALLGTKTHGIHHAVEAFSRGAAAVLVGTDLELDDEEWERALSAGAEAGLVLVATDCDGVTALGRLARAHRRRHSWQVVGITGSSGKTSTKDILRALLDQTGTKVVASHANWNNEIGVPLTLLKADENTDVVICEMGMRGLQQIAYLCDIADPDIGIVTTAGTAHLELLGSREAIIKAKAELLSGTWRGGVGIFPGAQPELLLATDANPDRLLPFGAATSSDEQENLEHADNCSVFVTQITREADGLSGVIDVMGSEREFFVPLHGVHQAHNFAAAVSALATIKGSLDLLPPDALILKSRDKFTEGRGNRTPLNSGGVLINDAYNANPESTEAALNELAATAREIRDTAGACVAILGRMAELGTNSRKFHNEIGAYAAQLGVIDRLIVVGACADTKALSDGWRKHRKDITTIATPEEAVDQLVASGTVTAQDTILLKASNSANLSRLATVIVEQLGAAADPTHSQTGAKSQQEGGAT